MTLLTPRRVPPVETPNSNTNTALSIYTSTGFGTLTADDYVDAARKLGADIIVGAGDVVVPGRNINGTATLNVGVKRRQKMGDRTQAWMKKHLEGDSMGAVFAPILPIEPALQNEYLEWLADEAITIDSLKGLAFYDPDRVLDVPATSAMQSLCRLSLDEARNPSEIIRRVQLGMDLCVVPFINIMSDAGIALDFSFPPPSPMEELQVTSSTSPQPLGFHLSHASNTTSVLPLSQGCICYTCTNHHRAYLHHLLAANEMLSWLLLQIHNHAVLQRFFASLRQSIARDTLDSDAAAFHRFYESELPRGAIGDGPRLRGYMYRSEGPGERKRNRPAWGLLGGAEDAVAEVES